MISIGPHSLADLFFQIHWRSDGARHTDAYAARAVNFWRDILPRQLRSGLERKQPGDRLVFEFFPGELLGNEKSGPVVTFSRNRFDPARIGSGSLSPSAGRFYPKGVLKDVAGVFSANREPFRCVGINGGHFSGGHGPPAVRPACLAGCHGGCGQGQIRRARSQRRGLDGNDCPGRRYAGALGGSAHRFFRGGSISPQRHGPGSDVLCRPRLVQHLDDMALDLMGSWDSHLPAVGRLEQVAGVGLNGLELNQNSALTDRRVHDLNQEAAIDFPDGQFDVVVCTASVEYLIRPDAVFADVARVLKPGGHFVLTFSNRWFETKAVQIWKELHEFERMGLVLEYFRRCDRFRNLQTYSVRGLMRPRHDMYFGRLRDADPVYAVWGEKR